MERCRQLRQNLFVLDLHYGKADFRRGHLSCCYFILEHPCDDDFLREQVLSLTMSGCSSFVLYGAYSSVWKKEFAAVSQKLGSVRTAQTVVDSVDEFADRLRSALSEKSFVPCDYFLVYDDKMILDEVVNRMR